MAAMGGEVMDKKVVSARLSRLLLEEREIVGAMAKLKELKNKLKVRRVDCGKGPVPMVWCGSKTEI